jgi:DNA polymerase delta subunit 1
MKRARAEEEDGDIDDFYTSILNGDRDFSQKKPLIYEPPTFEKQVSMPTKQDLYSLLLDAEEEEEKDFVRAEDEKIEESQIKADKDEESDDDDANDFYGEDDDDADTYNEEPSARPDPRYLNSKNPAFARPQFVAPLDGGGGDFIFQHTETTYRIDTTLQVPEVLVWGVTEQGNSVCCRVNWFQPYFFAAVANTQEMHEIKRKLDAKFRADERNPRNRLQQYVVGFEPIRARNLCGFHCNEPLQLMYKITMAYPSHVAKARMCLEKRDEAVTSRVIKTYEANIPFELRFMVDQKINGCEWVRLKGGRFTEVSATDKISTCQFECYAFPPDEKSGSSSSSIQGIPSHERGTLAPMRFLSYDIEVYRNRPGFPTADEDPIIVICAMLHVVGKGIVHKLALTTRKCNSVGDDAELIICKDEREMLLIFSQYIRACDPEALTGWNTTNFDYPYITRRADILGIRDKFMLFTRLKNKQAWVRQQKFESKAYGARVSNEMMCDGRFDFDGLVFMLRGQMKKFRMYTLNHVAKKVLNDQKADVSHREIPRLFNGSDEDRTKLVSYCLKDSELPLRILDKEMAVVNGIEQARVTGVPIKWLLSRGQGIKTHSNLLRYKDDTEKVPTKTEKSNTEYTAGGHVETPKRGFYRCPLASLDFGSLYPSIMIAYNICYSTKVNRKWAEKHLRPEDYFIPPPAIDISEANIDEEELAKKGKKERERARMAAKYAGIEPDFVFVKPHIKEGVLPRFLKTLLAARKAVRRLQTDELKAEDPQRWYVYDGRQLALKVCCNSVYGFLKAHTVTDKDLMSAVTSYGRNMLYKVKETIYSNYQDLEVIDCAKCREMGIDPEVVYEGPVGINGEAPPDFRPRKKTAAYVVYGDTDSVMVCFGDVTLADCCKYGAQIAAECTRQFEPPNNLVFEAVKLRAIYINKKRYCALEIEKLIPGEHIDDAIARGKVSAKGLENKRRDNAPINGGTQGECIKILLKEGNIVKAENYVKRVLSDLLMDRTDMSQLVVTKGLSKTKEQYEKKRTRQQHVELQKRIRKRSKFTGEVVPETGDRVPYIVMGGIIEGKHKHKAYELSEDPMYVLRQGIQINTEYYIEKQIWAGVGRLFTAVYEPEMCPSIKSSMSKREKSRLQVYKRLFSRRLPHMRRQKVRKVRDASTAVGSGRITAFTVAKKTCIECNCSLGPFDAKHVTCAACRPHEHMTRLGLEFERRELEKKKKIYWDQCRKCVNACADETPANMPCAEVTCENFFRRDKCLMDLEDLGKKFA